MMRPADNYFLQLDEPYKSTLQFLRDYILQLDKDITEKWQYGMPFFYYRDKRLCYCWVHKKLKQPYLGIVDGNRIDHPDLVQEKRARMKILLLDPNRDIPVNKIRGILKKAMTLYK
ncbi:MAG TPA: DUF1801 domain-containing protein [Chitinophagaceae bacterium]|nr:DUF1801 domain-containing protein [Chitinophagaceae bacterium]